MRVAHVDTGRDWRGGQTQVLLLLRGLRRRGHDVILAAPDAPLASRVLSEGIPWLPLGAGGELDLGAGARLAGQLGAFAPEALHAHTARAHTLARDAGARLSVPVLVSRRVLAPVGTNPFSRRKYGRGVARYLCISRAVMDVMLGGGIPAELLALVPSAVDVRALAAIRERVARDAAEVRLRELIGAAPDAVVVGAVGAMTREKGVEVFAAAAIEALRAMPECHAVWIGDGPERSRLERARAASGLGGRLAVLGRREDAHELLAQLTLFVSTSRHEGLGTAVLEAQALGVPVVVTDSGGVRDAVEDGVNGRIVREPGSVGRALIEMLGDPGLRQRWSRAGLASVEAFDADLMVERTLAEYSSVALGAGHARTD